MANSLKDKITSGVFWQGIANAGSFGMNFVISVILARLLSPKDFGVVAIVLVFVAILSVFVDSGFTTALIQKKDLDEKLDCSSVFFLNLAIATLVFIILFAGAPFIADWYKNQDLTKCIRILALSPVISAFSIVQGTLIIRRMQFNLNCRISWISIIVSGVIGIGMAFRGYGVWALIAQQLSKNIVVVILQWLWGKWTPSLVIDVQRIKTLFSFGSKMFFSGMLDIIYYNIYPILIGKLYQLDTLSYYNRGHHIPHVGMSIINSTIGNVLLPAFSTIQNDKGKKRILMEKGIKNIMFLVVPTMTFLFVTARPVTMTLYGLKWLSSVPYLQIFSLVFVLWPLHTINLQLLTACGKSGFFLFLEVVKKCQLIIIILLTWKYGPLCMAMGMAVSGFLSLIWNSWKSKELADFGLLDQIGAIMPFLLCNVVAGAAAYFSMKFFSHHWFQLAGATIIFGGIYLGSTAFFKLIPAEIFNLVKNKLGINK